MGPYNIVPMAETGFSHRLTPYKIVEHFFGRSYRRLAYSLTIKTWVLNHRFFFLFSHAHFYSDLCDKNKRVCSSIQLKKKICWVQDVRCINHPSIGGEGGRGGGVTAFCLLKGYSAEHWLEALLHCMLMIENE